jgi:hypothetical protein
MCNVSTTRAHTQAARAFVARVVLWAAGVVGAVILLGVLFTLADANADNWLVRNVLSWGRWLTTPFHDMFVRRDPKQAVLVNWLVAALAYLGLGALVAKVLRASDQ